MKKLTMCNLVASAMMVLTTFSAEANQTLETISTIRVERVAELPGAPFDMNSNTIVGRINRTDTPGISAPTAFRYNIEMGHYEDLGDITGPISSEANGINSSGDAAITGSVSGINSDVPGIWHKNGNLEMIENFEELFLEQLTVSEDFDPNEFFINFLTATGISDTKTISGFTRIMHKEFYWVTYTFGWTWNNTDGLTVFDDEYNTVYGINSNYTVGEFLEGKYLVPQYWDRNGSRHSIDTGEEIFDRGIIIDINNSNFAVGKLDNNAFIWGLNDNSSKKIKFDHDFLNMLENWPSSINNNREVLGLLNFPGHTRAGFLYTTDKNGNARIVDADIPGRLFTAIHSFNESYIASGHAPAEDSNLDIEYSLFKIID